MSKILDNKLADNKKPSKAKLKQWEHVKKEAIIIILSNPEKTGNISNPTPMLMKIPNKWKYPKGFPSGVAVEKTVDYKIIALNAELVLLWLYDNDLSEYSPAMLYHSRRWVLRRFSDAERGVDKNFEDVYNYDI
jgi:hypothetical protein